jgi:hypothetical protein
MKTKELETLAGIALCHINPKHYIKEGVGYERMIRNCVEHLRKNEHKCKKKGDYDVKQYLLILAKHYYILQDHVCKIRQLGYAFYRTLRAQGIEV